VKTITTNKEKFMIGKVLDRQPLFNGKVTRTLCVVPIEELKRLKYNPPDRSENAPKLLETIKEVGEVLNPLHAKKDKDDYTILDGHGRLLGAESIGLKELRVYVYEGPSKILDRVFVILNMTQRHFTGKHQIQVLRLGGPEMGKSAKKAFDVVKSCLTEEDYSNGHSPSPSFVKHVNYAANLVVSKRYASSYEEAFRDIYLHAQKHKMGRVLHEFVRQGRSDGKIKRFWGYIKKDIAYTSLVSPQSK
jgi:hypothetical protein